MGRSRYFQSKSRRGKRESEKERERDRKNVKQSAEKKQREERKKKNKVGKGDFKPRVSKLVIDRLSKHLKQGKLKDREDFKILARRLSKMIIVKEMQRQGKLQSELGYDSSTPTKVKLFVDAVFSKLKPGEQYRVRKQKEDDDDDDDDEGDGDNEKNDESQNNDDDDDNNSGNQRQHGALADVRNGNGEYRQEEVGEEGVVEMKIDSEEEDIGEVEREENKMSNVGNGRERPVEGTTDSASDSSLVENAPPPWLCTTTQGDGDLFTSLSTHPLSSYSSNASSIMSTGASTTASTTTTTSLTPTAVSSIPPPIPVVPSPSNYFSNSPSSTASPTSYFHSSPSATALPSALPSSSNVMQSDTFSAFGTSSTQVVPPWLISSPTHSPSSSFGQLSNENYDPAENYSPHSSSPSSFLQ